MTFHPAESKVEELRSNVRRLFGVRPRRRTAEERKALKRASRDPGEQSKRYKIKGGRVRRVE